MSWYETKKLHLMHPGRPGWTFCNYRAQHLNMADEPTCMNCMKSARKYHADQTNNKLLKIKRRAKKMLEGDQFICVHFEIGRFYLTTQAVAHHRATILGQEWVATAEDRKQRINREKMLKEYWDEQYQNGIRMPSLLEHWVVSKRYPLSHFVKNLVFVLTPESKRKFYDSITNFKQVTTTRKIRTD